MIGMSNLRIMPPPSPPTLDPDRAQEAILRVDLLLSVELARDKQRDGHFVELGQLLCEIRAKQYWRIEQLASFDDFLEKRFPQSRRKAYYLMAIHEQLPPPVRSKLKNIGWSKAVELVKVVKRDGERFDRATWLHKAEHQNKEAFQHEVKNYLDKSESEPWEIMYFKLYKSQVPVVEEALEIAGRMLGSDRSRGYCLEMICADFLAGAHLGEPCPKSFMHALARTLALLTPEQRQQVQCWMATEGASE